MGTLTKNVIWRAQSFEVKVKTIFFAVFLISTMTSAFAEKCPDALIRKVAYPSGTGEAKAVITLVDYLLKGNPNCGENTRPLITYYGEHHNHRELSKLIDHYQGEINLDAQTEGQNFHILHFAAENPFQLSNEIFWIILSEGGKVDPINKVTGLTPLLTILGPGANLTSANTFRKIYLSLMYGAKSTNLVHRVIQNYTYSAVGAKSVLGLILRPDDFFQQGFAMKAFHDSYYLDDLLKIVDEATVEAVNLKVFCTKSFSEKHRKDLNVFEYLKAEEASQAGRRNHITDYAQEMIEWLKDQSIEEDMCQRL
jgi:hypothetical protein